jgi:hypothetical protein
MATPAPGPRTYYWVVCASYAKGPAATPEQAQRQRDAIEALGACYFLHKIQPGSKDGPRLRPRGGP